MGVEKNSQLLKLFLDSLNSLKGDHINIGVLLNIDSLASSCLVVKSLELLSVSFSLKFFYNKNDLIDLCLDDSKNKIIVSSFIPEIIKGDCCISFSDSVCLFEYGKKVSDVKFDGCISITDNSFFVLKNISESIMKLYYLPLIVSIKNKSQFSESISEYALSENLIEKRDCFSLMGSVTRPLAKSFELSIDPYIPNISNNESEVLKFLSSGNLPDYKSSNLLSLSESQIHYLFESISSKVKDLESIGLISKKYILIKEEDFDPLKDLDEFNLFFESCIALRKPAIAIGRCISPPNFKNRGINIIKEFRLNILRVLDWFYNKNNVVESDKVISAIFSETIDPNLMPYCCRYIHSNFLKDSKKYLVFLADNDFGINCVIYHGKNKKDFRTSKFLESLSEDITLVEDASRYIFVKSSTLGSQALLKTINSHLDGIKIEEINQ